MLISIYNIPDWFNLNSDDRIYIDSALDILS
jgi:hypothetical protein